MSTKSRRGRSPKDLQGIRPRGDTYQVRVYGGEDPVTGKPVSLTGTATDEAAAIRLRNEFRTTVAEGRAGRTQATLAHLLREWLAGHGASQETVEGYRDIAETFIVPALGELPLTKLSRSGPRTFEQFYAELRRCRRRCDRKPFVEHHKGCAPDSDGARLCDKRCKPHACSPLGASTLRHIHVILNGALKSAVRWGWIGVNPVESTLKPRAPRPQPSPPSTTDAARIIQAAMSADPDWGAFVWLTMVTGARRGELVVLRMRDVTFHCAACERDVSWCDESCPSCERELLGGGRTATLNIRRGYVRRSGWSAEKDTKTHQMRRVALDAATADILCAQFARYADRVGQLGGAVQSEAYIFSYAPDHTRPCNPDGLTHRYSRMTAGLGLDTHIHELRHYSATELLAGGVDLRTVAGRLGHAGGGVTTLRVYAAWVRSADEQAAALLASRLTGVTQSAD